METIQDTADAYLSGIEDSIDSETYQEHAAVIYELLEWCGEYTEADSDHLTPLLVGQFIQKRVEIDDITDDYMEVKTVLENLIAYATQSDPNVTALYISEEQLYSLKNLSEEEFKTPPIPSYPHEHPWADHKGSIGDLSVNELCEYLEEFEYGSLAHAYVEVLQVIEGENQYVHLLDIDDIDFKDRTLFVDFDSDALVVELGLVTSHSTSFSSHTAEILTEYIENHRDESSGTYALFSGDDGRLTEFELNEIFVDAVNNAISTINGNGNISMLETYRKVKDKDITPSLVVRTSTLTDIIAE